MADRRIDDGSMTGDVASGFGAEWAGDEQPTGDLLVPPRRPADEPAASGLVAGRYRLEALLGEGGMGRVYRALDLQLERQVAVKLLYPGPGEVAPRLLKEARAQARVNHDHVATVVEVGASDGVPFIAMQLVDGPTLQRVAGGLSLEEKADVVRQAAEAVHAAHLEGLVHRDLKPGNIMLERLADNGWKAFVVDFGLVRELGAEGGHSVTAVAGTSHYMAPEQIRGEVGRIDWRTDVYALGATLYEILAGRPPFAGGSAAEILLRALEEPARFPKGEPRLPRDLEAIVLRCLEKEPRDRYGSVRELAEDLARFLRGEPVQARPVPRAVRLVRAGRRRPRLAAAAASALVVVAILLGLWVNAVLATRRVAEVSRRFGEEAAAMESIGRFTALQPLHDVRREQALIRARMASLEDQVERLGSMARGPGYLALGRGWLALDDVARARQELEAAWAVPYRTPDVAAALGEALARTYQAAVDEARRIPSKAQREARIGELEKELREPALEALAAGCGAATGSSAWVQGQLYLLEGRFDEALESADAARAATPWLHEAWRLQGDVRSEQAEGEVKKGTVEQALRLFALAGEAYASGIDSARSDVPLREAECRRRVRLMAVDDGVRLPVADRGEWALSACRDALVANPDSVAAHAAEAMVWRLVGNAEQESGGDPRPTLDRAAQAARAALAIDPLHRPALTELGLSLATEGRWHALHGADPRPLFREAVTTLERALAVDPNHAPPHASLASVYNDVAEWESEHGADPSAAIKAAFEHHETALRLSPADAPGHHNLAVSYLRLASAPERWGLDPADDALARAADHFRTAIALRPQLYQAYNGLGSSLSQMAQAARLTGKDPLPLLAEAIAAFDAALAIRPDFTFALFNRSIAFRVRARVLSATGGNPFPDLEASRRNLERARELAPDDPDVSSSLAATLALQAEEVSGRGGDPRELIAAGLAQAELTVTRNPGEAFAWSVRGDLFVLRAAETFRRGGDGTADLDLALAAVGKGKRVDPDYVDSWVTEGNAWLERARWSEAKERVEAARRAVAAYRHALELSPDGISVFAGDVAEAEGLLAPISPPPGPAARRSPAAPS